MATWFFIPHYSLSSRKKDIELKELDKRLEFKPAKKFVSERKKSYRVQGAVGKNVVDGA